MTPVEERIDHEEAKREAEAWLRDTEAGGATDQSLTAKVIRHYLSLLTEHSALREAVKHVVNDSPGTPTSVKVFLERALYPEDLPATESAQPEEERRG